MRWRTRQEYSVVGKSVPRVDGLDKVTGKALFCSDLKLPNMLYGKVLWSPYAHARIVSIDTSKAEKLPGVRVVVTGKDAPDRPFGMYVADQYIPARDVVRFAGEGVAAVAADSIDAAEEALELIDVKYEVLPALLDIEEAMNPDCSVVLHPEQAKYERLLFPFVPQNIPAPNVLCHHKIRKGDVEAGFKQADLVVENRFFAPRIAHSQLEPQNCIARVESDGGLTVWTSLQAIYRVKHMLCRNFNLPASKVRLISTYIGGAFGGFPKVEQFAVLLALKTKGAVKMVFTREEVFASTNCRCPQAIYIKDGVKKDGTLLAREMKLIVDGGAYADVTPILASTAMSAAVPTYRVPNFKLDSYGVYTNQPVGGPFRGFGVTQPLWAIEQQMDIIAEKLGISPLELRRKNILREGEKNVCGEVMHSLAARECLDKVAEWIEWDKPSGKGSGPWRKGKGIALGNKFTVGGTASSALVKVNPDATVELRTSIDEIGQGADTILSQIVAEEFGISMDKVKLVRGDSAVTPYDFGSISSRTTFYAGNAARLACQDAKRQLFERAAPKLKAKPDELEARGGKIFVKNSPRKAIAIADIFTVVKGNWGVYLDEGAEIVGKATFVQHVTPRDPETGQGERLVAFYTDAAQAVEVAVNIETGEVKVLKVGSAFNMGQPINPKLCEVQIEGGAGMGIGSAIYEEMITENGKVMNPRFNDYRLPSIKQIPSGDNMKTMIVVAPHSEGPFGAKGVGEAAMTPTAPAIGNAVYNAVGVRIKDLPITAEKVLQALKDKAQTAATSGKQPKSPKEPPRK